LDGRLLEHAEHFTSGGGSRTSVCGFSS